MTFVAAKRFGKRVIMMSDTMITDPCGTHQRIIPGQLKVIIVNPTTTIAFAGLSVQATDAIKDARCRLMAGASMAEIERELATTTTLYEGKIDFLVVAHGDQVTLKRIWSGQVSGSLEQACIGQRNLLDSLLGKQSESPRLIIPHEFEEELYFTHAFTQLFSGVQITESVGGFGIQVICSPYGHIYGSWAGVMAWDVIVGGEPMNQQQLDDRRSGKTQWGYNITAPVLRGVGVVGAIVPNAGIGHIYAPALKDETIKWRFERPSHQDQHRPILEEFQRRVNEVATHLGGGISPTIPPDINRMPTDAELEELHCYANLKPFSTTIFAEPGAFIISCQTGIAEQKVHADAATLGEDPAWTLRTAIDRINDEIGRRIGKPPACSVSD